jgi:hypothetical protein
MFSAPQCRCFVSMPREEYRGFIPRLPDDLQTPRETIPIKPAQDAYGGKTILIGKYSILR